MKLYTTITLFLIAANLSCTTTETVVILNSEKILTSIQTDINGNVYEGIVNQNNKTIDFTLPYYFRAEVEKMSFTYQAVGERISPDISQEGNYTTPKTVSIFAQDGSKVDYTITVSVRPAYEIVLDLEKTKYLKSDSVRIKGTNLGYAKEIALVTLNDINSIPPTGGGPSIFFNILSGNVRLNETELIFPLNAIPNGLYDVNLKFIDKEETLVLNDLIEVVDEL